MNKTYLSYLTKLNVIQPSSGQGVWINPDYTSKVIECSCEKVLFDISFCVDDILPIINSNAQRTFTLI